MTITGGTVTATTSTARISYFGFALAAGSALAAMLAGFGARFDLWHFTTGFLILKWSVYAATGAVLICVVGLVLARRGPQGRAWALAGLLASLVIIAIPVSWLYTAEHVPPIHDISTDTQDPPRFEAVLPLREGAANTTRYGGPAVAAQQHKAYPDIRPLIVHQPPIQVFQQALKVARQLGWEVVAADSKRGRIEATDTTFWFGFKDDVVVRIRPASGGSRVDVRSVSRVGRSDVGTNAARVRRYLTSLRKRLS